MATTEQSNINPAGRRHRSNEATGWVGWVFFAGIVMFTVGFFNIIEGLVALFNSGYYRVDHNGLVVHVNYRTWGWTLLIFGAVLVIAGYGVLVGQTWARVVGVILAVLNAMTNFAFLAAYPVWVVLTISLDVLVVYALIAHGREAKALT
jgi:hypothetical protein